MKNLFTLLLLIAPMCCLAQVEKGKLLLTGNIAYSQNSNENGTPISTTATSGSVPKVTEIEFSPYVGYMITSRFAAGIFCQYAKNETKSDYAYQPNTKTEITRKSIGPFVRYYHPIGEKFFVFGQADYSYAKAEWTMTVGSNNDFVQKSISTGNIIAVRPGISYFVTKHLAVEAILGSISYSKTDFKIGHNNGFDFRFITRGFSTGVTFVL